jgi:hypothetical protein
MLGNIMKSQNFTLLLALSVVLTMAAGVNAEDKGVPNPALSVLSSGSSAELPAKAAGLVAQADAKNLKQTTIDVVKAAVGLNPAAAPAIVGSIAQAVPNAAATASAQAAVLVPNQAVLIARAAAAACPSNAAAIVEAMCLVLPADYEKVAVAVSEVVPGAAKDILMAIETAIPQLKAAIDQTIASYQGNLPSLSTLLSQVAQTESSATTLAIAAGTFGPSGSTPTATAGSKPASLPRGLSVGNPYVPVTGTPIVITPGSGGQVPPNGGRGYAQP